MRAGIGGGSVGGDLSGGGQISFELREKRVEPVVSFLSAKTAEQRRFEAPPVVVEVSVPIQDVDFGHGRSFLESWFGSDADGGRTARPIREHRLPRVDPVPGEQRPAQIEIRGGDSDRSTSLITGNDLSDQGMRSTKDSSGVFHPADRKELPNHRTPRGHVHSIDEPYSSLFGNQNLESSRSPTRLQGRGGTGAIPSKAEVRPFSHDGRCFPQSVEEVVEECLRLEPEELPRRLEFEHIVESDLQQPPPALIRGQYSWLRRTPENHRRGWLEGHRDRPGVASEGGRHCFSEKSMAQVDTVKVADRDSKHG